MATPSMSPSVRDPQTLALRLLDHDPSRQAHVPGAGLIAGMAAGALGVDRPEEVVAAA